jgi:hypothetical protein
LFKARSGFAQVKPADVAKYGSFATQTIMFVYCVPKSALIADVLSNVVMQLCSHTASVVEQPVNPLARQQFLAQASANVVMGVPGVAQVAPVVLPLPQAKTPEATPNTRTSDPTLFNMLSLTETQVSPSRHSPQEAFPGDLF